MKICIKKNNQISAPFTKDELQEKIYSGEFSRTDLAALEGSENWLPLASLLANEAPPVMAAPPTVTLENLRDPKEKTALLWLYFASVPMWIFLIVFIIAGAGIPLVFLAIFWLFHLFGELWFAAYVKTNAVRISETQLPELNRAVDLCCKNLGMERPDVYVLQHNIWNAFATKVFGRRMVVLLSGAVDSILLKGDMSQLTWVVGHELGHHWAGHLNFSQKLAKLGGWLIWVTLWHSRRAEFTCDRVGLFCTGSLKASQLALINATVGAQLASKVNVDEAVKQWEQHSGEFFVKYRTLYSTHPHLLARLLHLNNAAQEFGMSR